MPQAKSSKKTGKPRGYQAPDTEGKLYRVRDKDYGDGSPVTVWGENLTYEAARLLKERVCGTKKSRTARVEDMEVSIPSADPVLETVRQKALAAGRVAASAAQQRADQAAARRKHEAQAASTPKPLRPPPKVKHKPVAMESMDADIEIPEVPDEDEDLGEIVVDEMTAAEEQAKADASEYEQKGRELYDAYMRLNGSGGRVWADLNAKEKAVFSFEAAAGQGPHVTAVAAASNGTGGEIPSEASESAPS